MKSTPKNSVNSRQNSQNWSKFAKFGQHFAFSMLKSTPARKKYTTAGCGGCDKYELWWSHFKQRQELSAASQGNRTKTSSSEDGGALGQPPRCGHLCHRLLGRGHVQCHVSWHRDRGNVKDAAIFPLNINYIICNIYLWLILRCSRKLSLVEGRFSKWF